MPVLFEFIGLLLLGSGVYLFMSARDTAAENRRLSERLLTQDELLHGFEARLRYLESRLCAEHDEAGTSSPARLEAPEVQRSLTNGSVAAVGAARPLNLGPATSSVP